MNSKFKFLTIALLFFSLLQMFLLSSCKQKEDLSSFKHSIRDDVDLYLIPEKFNILESEWVNLKGIGTYLKSDLIRHLKSYGRTLSDLQNDPDLQYSEKDDVVTLHIKKLLTQRITLMTQIFLLYFTEKNGLKKGKIPRL
jgi:hypothetical protein